VGELRVTLKSSLRIKLGGKRNQLVRQSMQCGVVLIAFAYFESYFREVVEDVFASLSAGGVSSSSLAEATRTQVAIGCRLDEWARTVDPAKQSKQIWTYRGVGGFDLLEDSLVVRADVATALLAGITYPKLDNVRKLLARLGIDDPLARLRSTAKMQIDQYLVSFHDARVDLAHNGTPPGWSEADFEVKLSELMLFAKALDKVLYGWVGQASSYSHWPK
jgi:hypothetical protein